MSTTMKLIDKNILITGATSGIGLKLVEKLYQNNSIHIIARDKNKILELQSRYPDLIAYQANLNSVEQLQKAVEEMRANTTKLDVLINNAAVQYTPMLSSDDFVFESIEDEITTNFTAVCCLCYLLLPMLNQNHKAIILNVNSGLGFVPKASSAIYCATKGALDIFSQSLRHQFADTPLQVLQAFLPLVDTHMTKGRGSAKISVEEASERIIYGIEKTIIDHDIGKVKLLRFIQRLSPSLAKIIMRNS